MKIDGTDVRKVLRNLEHLRTGGAQRRVIRKSAESAASLLAKAVKNKCPTETKTLKKSIGRKTKTFGDVVWVGVGVRIDGEKYWGRDPDGVGIRKPEKYAHLVERMRPFFRPVFDSLREAARMKFVTRARALYKKELAKLRSH